MSRIIENPKGLILSNAKELLYNEGFKKFSMRNLSRKCGIALGTIYNYYSTKEELIIEMMTDWLLGNALLYTWRYIRFRWYIIY